MSRFSIDTHDLCFILSSEVVAVEYSSTASSSKYCDYDHIDLSLQGFPGLPGSRGPPVSIMDTEVGQNVREFPKNKSDTCSL